MYGDSYEMFAFKSYPHPVLAALRRVDVNMVLPYDDTYWEQSCNDYDLQALDQVAWFDSFGGSYRSMHYLSLSGEVKLTTT